MKINLLTLFFIVSLSGSAWARLGETEDQLTTRYGEEIKKGSSGVLGKSTPWIHFRKSGFDINVTLFNGVSAEERISNALGDPMTDQDIKTLLEANAQDHAWKGLASGYSPGSEWHRDDGAVADFNGANFDVISKALIDAKAAAYNAAHAHSLEGF